LIPNPVAVITTSPECELHGCRSFFAPYRPYRSELYDERHQRPAVPIEQSHDQTRRLPMLWLIVWWFLLLGWWFLLLGWWRRLALRLGRRALLSRRVGRLRLWLRSWLGFRLRCWLGLSGLWSRSGCRLSAALGLRGGLRRRRWPSCRFSWCSRGRSRSLGWLSGRPLGRLCRCRSGRSCRHRLGMRRLPVCRRPCSRGSTRRNHSSDRFPLRDWLGSHNNGRTPVIDGSKLLTILCSRLLLLYLRCHWGNALLASCSKFRR